MATPVSNFGKATVSTTYGSAEVTIVLTTGHGSRFPSTFPYNLTWWNATDYPDPADDPNREIVTVTNRVTDTLTVTRGAELSGASTKNTVGKTYKMFQGVTKALVEELQVRGLSGGHTKLVIATLPGSADKSVRFTADSIVMEDGEDVKDWGPITVNGAVTGFNGLDAGSLVGATWYSVWAIYNGSTKAGLLHREADWFLFEDATAGEDATQGIRSAVDNSNVKVGQGFKVNTAGPLPFVDVKLIKVGAPGGQIWFTIETDSGGVPSGTAVATSEPFNIAKIPTAAVLMRIPFRTPPTISAFTQYHIVAQGNWAVSATDYVGWRMDGSAATYINGSKALWDSDTSTWTADTDDDLIFRVYIERNKTSVTVPAGYRKAFLGYAYYLSGLFFSASLQINTQYQLIDPVAHGLIVNETSGARAFEDLRAWLPALPSCRVAIMHSGTGAAIAAMAYSTITGPNLDILAPGTSLIVAMTGNTTTERPEGVQSFPVEYAMMYTDGTAGCDLYFSGFSW